MQGGANKNRRANHPAAYENNSIIWKTSIYRTPFGRIPYQR
jgi:hypothetical protein